MFWVSDHLAISSAFFATSLLLLNQFFATSLLALKVLVSVRLAEVLVVQSVPSWYQISAPGIVPGFVQYAGL